MALRSGIYLTLISIFSLAAVVPRSALAQHISVDGRFSPAQTLAGPNYAIAANLGKQVGGNLFHSFGIFGLTKGESATFSGPAAVSNVIGRVTGGNPSSINGNIKSTIAGANLYLINPSGVVFGPNATINVSGSFHASTADYLKMSDGAKFQATNPDGSTLSAAPPAAFGFLNARPAAITVNGSSLGPVPGTLGLVGGPVSVTGGTLSAPAGTIHVASAAGTGEVPVDPRNSAALTVTNFGPVSITNSSTNSSMLNVSDPTGLGSGGSVFIRSGTLIIKASEINADNYGPGTGGEIALQAAGQIALGNGANIHAGGVDAGRGGSVIVSASGSNIDNSAIDADTRGAGNAGDVNVTVGTLAISNDGVIASRTFGSGNGGTISVSISGQLAIIGKPDGSLTGIVSDAGRGSTGNAGNVVVSAGTLNLVSNGEISSSTFASGNAGSVSVTVGDQLSINGILANPGFLTSIATQTEAGSTGNAGSIAVSAGSLSILGHGLISSRTSGPGNGGTVSVTVAGELSIAGEPDGSLTGIVSDARRSSTGNAGNVVVSAGTLNLVSNGEISSSTFASGNAGNVSVTIGDQLSIDGTLANPSFLTGIAAQTETGSIGNAGSVQVNAGSLSIANSGTISASTYGLGAGGNVTSQVGRTLSISGDGSLLSTTGIFATTNLLLGKNAGNITLIAGSLSIVNGGEISASTSGLGSAGSVKLNVTGDLQANNETSFQTTGVLASTFGSGNAGRVSVEVGGQLSLDGGAAGIAAIAADSLAGTGNAGNVSVGAGALSIVSGGEISSNAGLGSGVAGNVSVDVRGQLTIDGGANGRIAVITADSLAGTGNAGNVSVGAGALSIVSGGEISSDAGFGFGVAGNVSVDVRGQLTIDGGANGIALISAASVLNSRNSGNITVHAAAADIVNGGKISTVTLGSAGNAGDVSVDVTGRLSIDSGSILSSSDPLPGIASTGNAGNVAVKAAELEIVNGGVISANTSTSGEGGTVKVVASTLTISRNGAIVSNTFGSGTGGSVSVTVDGQLTIDGTAPAANLLTGIATNSEAGSTGNAGDVTVRAGSLSLINGADISSGALGASNNLPASTGNAGQVTVTADALTVNSAGLIATNTFGGGNGGAVFVTAGTLSIASNGAIVSNTFGSGMGGSVSVTVDGQLTINGAPGGGFTGIASNAEQGKTGDAGSVTVRAEALNIARNGEIAGNTFGAGNGGSVSVSVAGQLTIDANSADTRFLTGIDAQANPGSSGMAGAVRVSAGSLTSLAGGKISSRALGADNGSPASTGNAGTVSVNVTGLLSIDGSGSAIATSTEPGTSGNAGSVTVAAGQITIASGGAIASTTAGMGAGGSVQVTTPGTLVLDGTTNSLTEIAASAIGPQSGPGGAVTVQAGSITIEGGAEIASSTAGPGKGGNVDVVVASDIVLPDPGPQITAQSTGSGDAGSITISAVRLLMNNGANISTEAETSTANGGNIMLSIGDFLYLVGSEITTSVKGETGNGGNITIDPDFTVLNHSSIIAQAVEGHGGNITINAGTYIASADSLVSASSQLGISGMVTINGPLVDLNGTLVVLSSELR
ncbi:MAG: filamentous hemagglutinin N-terminal domain-containing protein, partial [Acidobacteria bacterium]|nr:filamentous hemagglutinin N-terminal domain-containing protein [Acidobacteriota bacterium]